MNDLLPCASICLLALSLNFRPSPDIRKCSYCVWLRGLSSECREKPRNCAEWDPDALLYCLNRDEHPWGRESLNRSVRCIAHANLSPNNSSNASDKLLLLSSLALLFDRRRCSFDNVRHNCRCSDCPSDDLMPQFDSELNGQKNEMRENSKEWQSASSKNELLEVDGSSTAAVNKILLANKKVAKNNETVATEYVTNATNSSSAARRPSHYARPKRPQQKMPATISTDAYAIPFLIHSGHFHRIHLALTTILTIIVFDCYNIYQFFTDHY